MGTLYVDTVRGFEFFSSKYEKMVRKISKRKIRKSILNLNLYFFQEQQYSQN